MKKGKQKEKKQKKSSQQFNLNNTNENVTKFVGNINGFQVYDKIDDDIEKDITEQKDEDPKLKELTIIQPNSNKTESRFANLFQEIIENDKKEEQKKENKIDEKKFEENLLPNNIINDIDNNDDDNNKNLIINEEINNANKKMEYLNLNDNNNIINKDNIIINNNNSNNSNMNRTLINNFFNNFKKQNNLINNNQNLNLINNNYANNNINNNPNMINFNNIPNNNIINNNSNNLFMKYNQNINNNNIKSVNTYNIYPENLQEFQKAYNNFSNSSSNNTTAPSSMDRANSISSFLLNASGNYNKNEYFYFPNKNSSNEQSPRSEKKFDINIDIKRIIYLEDRRTTLMIKNIPNKFNRELLLKMINENFEGAYNLFILPTDANGIKNFGYSFINFTNCYYIPYFYYLFNNKTWPKTNSKKVCVITYSKIQGKNGLLAHYANKIIYKNDSAKKNDNIEQKYKIPYEYADIFFSAYPKTNIEKCDHYFLTKMPFRY